ncbi:TlpA family protein disulfide reductase [Massilia glaciei]|uniref:TlpA family protein disulfide reductase n=1 Tax=Massilia glaciei TaxID=1524097 RepID=A0A2U2HP81_9BURK|nr:TlpA disulfide reductase family protein [Massilia glaciei]PWF49320.1 TlpA family protein disulfide reductase [Massilia glaciei]
MNTSTSINRKLGGFALLMLVLWAPAVQAQVKVGDPVPEYIGSRNGKALAASDFLGKVLVISFWASWCGPCQKEIPVLETVQKTAGKEQLQVVGINIQSSPEFGALMRGLPPMEMMFTRDIDDRGSKLFGRKGVPHMVVVGRDGRIRTINVGYGEDSIDEIVGTVNAALAEKPVKVPAAS